MPSFKVPKRPAGWLYLPLAWLSRLACRVIFGLKITGRERIPKEGPLLVLCAHQGMIDFLMVIAALGGRRVQFVATERQFRNPKLHWAFRRLGMIPKVQFHTDPRCTMGILRTLRAGGTVGIFPAGQTSLCGVPTQMDPVIARLVKRAGVPVCTVALHGGFLTFSRFAPWFSRGRTEADLALTFTPGQLEALSEEEIFRTLQVRLDFDDYAWQQRTGARFAGRRRAEGYQKVLFRCPACQREGTIRSRGNRVNCAACGAAGQVGDDMRIAPLEGKSPLPQTLKEWFFRQEHALAAAARDPAFRIAARVRCQLFERRSFAWKDVGEGVLCLSRESLCFEAIIQGSPAALPLRNESLTGCSGAPGEYIELYHEGRGLMRYRPLDPGEGWILTAIKTGQELIHRRGRSAALFKPLP